MTYLERFYAEALSYALSISRKEGIKTNLKSAQVSPSLAVIAVGIVSISFVFPLTGYAQTNETSVNWFMKGYDLCQQEKYNESLEAYDKALELNSSDFEAWNNRGIDLGLLGNYDEALRSFQNAVALNESYAEAWYNMGVIYDFKGEYYTAVQAYKRATQIDPSYQNAWERRNANTDMIMRNSISCSSKDQIILV